MTQKMIYRARWHRHRWIWTCVGTWGNDDRQECRKCGKIKRSL